MGTTNMSHSTAIDSDRLDEVDVHENRRDAYEMGYDRFESLHMDDSDTSKNTHSIPTVYCQGYGP